jgi:hypothetical protein
VVAGQHAHLLLGGQVAAHGDVGAGELLDATQAERMQYFSIMLAATLDQRSVAAEGTIMSSTATGGETEEEMKAAHTSSATKTTPLDTRSFPSIAPTSSQTAVASAGVPSAFSSSAKRGGGETGLHHRFAWWISCCCFPPRTGKGY